MQSIKRQFNNWTKLDYSWLIIANAIILGLSLYWDDGLIPIVSAITGITCVIFVSKQMVLNYWIGAINVALYAFLAFQSKLYGDVMLNALYYFPMQFIGMDMWMKAEKNNNGAKVDSKSLTSIERMKLLVSSILLIVLYSIFLKVLGGNIPMIDATSTVLSVIAMILMVKQYKEQWWLWIVVNSVSIAMWVISLKDGTGDIATLIMWILYLANSLYGLYNWNKADKE